MRIDPRGNEDSSYVVRAYSANQNRSLVAAVRYPTVLPGEEIHVYAYPRSLCGWRSHHTDTIKARVTLTDATPCEADGELCTLGTCIRGQCREEEIICADDGNPCTRDECNPDTGACYDPLPDGTPCYDENKCTLAYSVETDSVITPSISVPTRTLSGMLMAWI